VATLVLQARLLLSRRGQDDLAQAHELLIQAVREAPAAAEAHGWLALSHVTRANYLGDGAAGFERAEAAADRALAIDPDCAVAHSAKGLVALNLRLAYDEAIAEQRRAVALDPLLVPARQFLAEALSAAERHEEALSTIDGALAIEPLSPLLHGVRGLVLLRAGRPLAALEAFDRVLVLEPRFGWFQRYRAYALARLHRDAEAAEALFEEARSRGEPPDQLAALRREIDRDGVAGYWRWRLGRLDAMRAAGVRQRPTELAEALAGVGRLDESLAELARAPGEGEGEYFLYHRDSMAFEPLRDDPAFLALYRGGGPEGLRPAR
jgi:Tfp pilus assembly protein PilF